MSFSIKDRNKIIEDNLDLVTKNVKKLLRKSSRLIDEDELTNHLNLSFVLAADKFNPDKNVPFRRYIDSRLSYCAISYLRSIDHLNVANRKKQKNIDKVINTLSHRLNRLPTDAEVSDYLGISIDKYNRMLVNLQSISFYSIINNDNTDSPFDIIDDERISNDIVKSNNSSPEDLTIVSELASIVISTFNKHDRRSKLLYMLYFIYNFSLQDLSELFGITIIYISRLISSINSDIAETLKPYTEREQYG